MRLRIYPASKIEMAPFVRALAEAWKEFDFVARWPELCKTYPSDPHLAPAFWDIDLKDIAGSQVVLVIPGDNPLRGAIFEAGYGKALGKMIVLVGSQEEYGTWQYADGIRRVPSLEAARELLTLYASSFTWP